MAITLPTQKSEPTMKSPRTLMIYSLPKIGKTGELSKLEDNLILDFEQGTEGVTAMKININTYQELNETVVALAQKYKANGNKPVYKYISVDVIDKLEELARRRAAEQFGKTNIGKSWYEDDYIKKGDSIENLPKGAGYGWIRKAVMFYLEMFKQASERLIVIAHVKDKLMPKMDGKDEVFVKDIALTGALGSIVAADMDAIGYMYREGATGEKLMISFQQTEGSAVMGSRKEHLRGKKFEFDWNRIYID